MRGFDRGSGRKTRWGIEHQKAISRGRGAGVGGDGSAAGGGDAAAADSRNDNRGCGVADAAMWL